MTPYQELDVLREAAKLLQQKCDRVIKSKIEYSYARLVKDTPKIELLRTELALRHDLTMIEGANEELRRALYPASDAVSVLRLGEQETVQHGG